MFSFFEYYMVTLCVAKRSNVDRTNSRVNQQQAACGKEQFGSGNFMIRCLITVFFCFHILQKVCKYDVPSSLIFQDLKSGIKKKSKYSFLWHNLISICHIISPLVCVTSSFLSLSIAQSRVVMCER